MYAHAIAGHGSVQSQNPCFGMACGQEEVVVLLLPAFWSQNCAGGCGLDYSHHVQGFSGIPEGMNRHQQDRRVVVVVVGMALVVVGSGSWDMGTCHVSSSIGCVAR